MSKNVTDFPRENRLLVDWFSFTTKVHSRDDIVALIGMQDVLWEHGYGNKGFQYKISYNGVYVHWCDEWYESPLTGFVWLEMTGQGCRTFESFGTGDFNSLFKLITDELPKRPCERGVRAKRIDIAFDDMTGILDIDTVFNSVLSQSFTARSLESHAYYEFKNGIVGKSVDFGSKYSNVFIRIYDKAAQRGFTPAEVPHWVRCELQLKDGNASGFLDKAFSKYGLQEMYASCLRNYLCFRVPDEFDSNKNRWQEADWWLRFLDNAVARSVWEKPGSDYNALAKTEEYIFSQPLGGIQALVEIMGPGKFLNTVMSQPPPKNPKYKRMVAEYKQERLEDIDREMRELEAALSDARLEVQKTHSKEVLERSGVLWDRYMRLKQLRAAVKETVKEKMKKEGKKK